MDELKSVWDLSLEQIALIHRLRHMNHYVHAGLLTVHTSHWPSSGEYRLRTGVAEAALEAATNEVLGFVPRLKDQARPHATRVALTERVFALYRALPNVANSACPQMMELLASLAFLPLVAERNDGLALWLHPPVRRAMGYQRRAFALALRPFRFEDVARRFDGAMDADGWDREDPLRMVFAITPLFVQSIIVMIERGMFHELALTAFRHVERAMRDFERRHGLGDNPAMPLNVGRPGQVRYRNTVYLYGGNLLERMGRKSEARRWYLRDIDDPQDLLPNLGSYLAGFKTIERLLCAYRITPPAEQPDLLELIHGALSRVLGRARHYAAEVLDAIARHPQIDWSTPRVQVGDKVYLYAGEACREPMLAALVYQRMIRAIPYSGTSYDLLCI